MKRAISLFSGGGGLDCGVEEAGFNNICSIEIDPNCAETLRKNSGSSKKVWNVDVRAISPVGLAASLGIGIGDLELLHGGPPCQSFSQIGKRAELCDERGLLAFEMIRFAQEIRPKAVLIEQVGNFLKAKFSDSLTVVDEFRRRFDEIGYTLESKLLDASRFGVAQKRQRAILVAVRSDTIAAGKYAHPKGDDNLKSVAEALLGLPDAKPKSDIGSAFPNHIDVTPPRDRVRISMVLEGEWLSKSDAPAELKGNLQRKDTTKFRRLSSSEPSITLRCGEIFFHPKLNRYITPREAARIHGYSDKHVFYGPIRGRSGTVKNLDQHRQVANSVPPPLGFAVASSIREQLCL